VQAAERAAGEGRQGADHAARTAPVAAAGEWYRFWIVRLDRDLAVAKVQLHRRDEMLAAAHAACLHARQRYEALERLREKAYAAYLAGINAAEKKIIDDLATQRYALRRDGRQGA
jgi:flagellar export protein FliJ